MCPAHDAGVHLRPRLARPCAYGIGYLGKDILQIPLFSKSSYILQIPIFSKFLYLNFPSPLPPPATQI